MITRSMTKADLTPATTLFVDVFNAPPWNDGWSPLDASLRLRRFMASPDWRGVIAVEGESVLGFALGFLERWLDSDHFLLKEMCVALAAQRSGVGTHVLGALERVVREEGATAIYLQTRPDSPASRFYEKCGFRRIALASMIRLSVPTALWAQPSR